MRLILVALLLISLPTLALARPKGGKAPGAAKRGAAAKASNAYKAVTKPGGVAGTVKEAERPAPAPVAAAPTSAPAPKGPTRIDFDDRLIEGQTNKSGAVYLYDRKDLQVESMVKQPSTFRAEIARGLFE